WILYGQQVDPLFYADRIRLMAYDRATRAHSGVLTEWDRSPQHWAFAKNGRIVFEGEDNARVRLFALERGKTPEPLSTNGSIGGFDLSRSGRLFATLQTLSDPAEIHTRELSGGALSRLTHFTDEATSRFSVGEAREMTF